MKTRQRKLAAVMAALMLAGSTFPVLGAEGQDPSSLAFNPSVYGYFDYTDDQLKSQFRSYSLDVGADSTYKETVYYDGEGELSVKRDEFGQEYVDLSGMDPSNTIVIEVINDAVPQSGISRYVDIYTRMKQLVTGISENTTLQDLKALGNVFAGDTSGYNDYGISFYSLLDGKSYAFEQNMFTYNGQLTDGTAEKTLVQPPVLFDVETEYLDPLFQEYEQGGSMEAGILNEKMFEILKDKRLNGDAYAYISVCEE